MPVYNLFKTVHFLVIRTCRTRGFVPRKAGKTEMIRMAKKGVPHTKIVATRSIGVRETDEMGECVCIKLDDFEILLTPEVAQSMAAQVFAKVRKIQDRAAMKNQQPLPIPAEGGA